MTSAAPRAPLTAGLSALRRPVGRPRRQVASGGGEHLGSPPLPGTVSRPSPPRSRLLRRRSRSRLRRPRLRRPRPAQRKRKRRRLGVSTAEGADRLRANRPGHLWALDFQHDATTDGRELKFLNIVDEFTREALAVEVERTIDADQTVAVVERLVAERGVPANVRADNGPELTARVLREWCEAASTATAYIDPGAPWQNAWVESPASSPTSGARTTTPTIPTRRLA